MTKLTKLSTAALLTLTSYQALVAVVDSNKGLPCLFGHLGCSDKRGGTCSEESGPVRDILGGDADLANPPQLDALVAAAIATGAVARAS